MRALRTTQKKPGPTRPGMDRHKSAVDLQRPPERRPTYTRPWRKLLWLSQDYPDNYVDSSFLSQLRRNSTVTQYSYWKLVLDFSLMLMHFCDTAIVIIIFYGLYNYNWSPYTPLLICLFLTLTGYFIWDMLAHQNKLDRLERLLTLKSSLLIVFTILTLSPVLRSLTKSTSLDSIWALSTWLTCLNVICHNYEYDLAKDGKFELSVLLTNLLFANVIVLSSRLSLNMSVFCFILVLIEVYGLFPIFQHKLRRSLGFKECGILCLLYFCAVSILLFLVIRNHIIIFTWFLVNFFVLFFCPAYFIFLQQYKNELQGPWDPARPKI